MLDAALQGLAAAMPDAKSRRSGEATYLPVSFETIRVFGDVGRRARCRAELVEPRRRRRGKLGRIVADRRRRYTDRRDHRHLPATRRTPRTVPLPLTQKIFDTAWVESPVAPAGVAAPRGSWLVLTETPRPERWREFIAQWRSPTRRVISADLTDESAVLEAFARNGGRPRASAGRRGRLRRPAAFDGTGPRADAAARGRDSLGDLADGSRDHRRLARRTAPAVAGHPRRSRRQRRRAGRPVDRRA